MSFKKIIEQIMPDFLPNYIDLLQKGVCRDIDNFEKYILLKALEVQQLESYYPMLFDYMVSSDKRHLYPVIEIYITKMLPVYTSSVLYQKQLIDFYNNSSQTDKVESLREKYPLVDDSPLVCFDTRKFSGLNEVSLFITYYLSLAKSKYLLGDQNLANKLYQELYPVILDYACHKSIMFANNLECYAPDLEIRKQILDLLNSIPFQEKMIDAYVENFQADKVSELRKQYPLLDDSPSDCFSTKVFANIDEVNSVVTYYFSLAKCKYFLGEIEETKKIYKELFPVISNYANDQAFTFVKDAGSYAPGLDVEKKMLSNLISSIDSVEIYALLGDYSNEITKKNFNLYQERALFIIELLKEKAVPIPTKLYIKSHQRGLELALMQWLTLDLCEDNSKIYRALSSLLMKNQRGLHKVFPVHLERKEKIRVGVNITRFNSIEFETAIYSLFEKFDTEKFELIFFAGMTWLKNADLSRLEQIFHKIVYYNSSDYIDLRNKVVAEKVDVFLSENICLPASSFIFFSRVAPVQINIWDRFVSFGTPYIDYYMTFGSKQSYKSWTKDKKQKHESYAHMSNSYMCSEIKKTDGVNFDFHSIGLPNGASYIFYPQSLRRMMVEDDEIIKKLLENNPQVYFVALSANGEEKHSYYYRWKHVMPHVMDRVLFLARVSIPHFISVIENAACIIGGFKGSHGTITNATIFSCGQPIVAGCGETFSNSLTKFYYAKMGVDGLIAHTPNEAVEICQHLLDAPEWKEQKSKEILDNYHKLSNIKTAAEEVQDFLIQAYERALSGKTPTNWDHGMFEDDPNYVGGENAC